MLFSSVRIIALGLIALIAAQLTTLLLAERNVLQKYQNISLQEWSFYDWTTAVLSLTAGICFAFVVTPPKQLLRQAIQEQTKVGDLLFTAAIILFLSTSILSLWFPQVFLDHVSEVRVISLSQELFILTGFALLSACAIRAVSIQLPRIFGIPGWLLLSLTSGCVLLLLLEEISFGQHIFGWSTPDNFEGNVQSETNFHNFYTYRFEIIYYWSAMMCFMILPLIKLFPISQKFPKIFYYIPPIQFALAAVPIGTLLYESWSIVALQFQFFLALGICSILYSRSEGTVKLKIGALLLSVAICLYTLVFFGERLVDGYEPSEMRELAISIYIAAYAAWIFSKVRKSGSTKSSSANLT